MAIEQVPSPASEDVGTHSRNDVVEVVEVMDADIETEVVETQLIECVETTESSAESSAESSEESEDSDDSESDDCVGNEAEEEEMKESSCEGEAKLPEPCSSSDGENSEDEKNDSAPENPHKLFLPPVVGMVTPQQEMSKLLTPKPTKSKTISFTLQKIDENKELEATTKPTDLAVVITKTTDPTTLTTTSPTAEEVSRFINDKSAYIEDVFKCMLRGISNSKLSMVKNGFSAPSSITELEEGEGEAGDEVMTSQVNNDVISPEVKIVKLIQNLDYFIEIVCSIKSSDARDTYSIIVLYEKLIFDLKSEIQSLSKSLMIYKTIVGQKQGGGSR